MKLFKNNGTKFLGNTISVWEPTKIIGIGNKTTY